MSESFEVLVTDCQVRAGLAVARSLARRGVRVLGLCSEPGSPAFYSRILTNVLRSPSAIHEPEAFVQFTLQTIRKFRIQLAIPITDQAVLLFDQHRAGLESLTRVAMASASALRSALDKRINLDLAVKVGVPCAKQFELTSLRQIPEMIDVLGFPIVLKRPGDPVDKTLPAFSFRVLYAHNEEQLRGLSRNTVPTASIRCSRKWPLARFTMCVASLPREKSWRPTNTSPFADWKVL